MGSALDQQRFMEGVHIFGTFDMEEFDKYWIAYALHPLNKIAREKLKSIGWRLQRHSRTLQEIWVLDKIPEGESFG